MTKLEQAARQMMDALEMQIHGAGSIIHSKLAWQAGHNALSEQAEQEPVATDLMDMLRLIETIKYLRGIAERGLGREIREDETIEQFVLGYVKQLESTQPVKQEPVLRYAHIKCPVCDVENPGIHKCAAPVHTKDLSDDDLRVCFKATNTSEPLAEGWPGLERFARAVIDADREKNK